MIRRNLLIHSFVAVAMTVMAAAGTTTTHPTLSAEEIVKKNVAARGGLQAWRAIQTLSMSGKMQAGGNNRPVLPVPGTAGGAKVAPPRPTAQAELPFVLDLKRPLKMRVELQFAGKTALQVYDGTNGWKLRPFLNRNDVEPYTAEEAKAALTQSELDGELVDYQAKGTKIELAGMEKIEDKDTYNLKLTLKNGQEKHVWVDADTFLEARVEGTPRRLDGTIHPVYVYYRDYRQVHDVKVPFTLETKVQFSKPVAGSTQISEKITIDSVEVNPKLDESLFTKPQLNAAPSASQAHASIQQAPTTTRLQ
ncbi:MAG TPA: hypothetical protein VGG85_04850 [Terracidiphilus sp.]|jgi:hypothetical protein